jgi:far upstream element-binding protein
MIATIQVPVPNDKVGLVIGRGGMTIRAIQDKTGAHVQIPREGEGDDPNMRIITVSAPNHEAAEAAQAEIHSILEGRRGGGGGGAPMPQALIMHVKNDKIGLIIGRAGATIKDLQARTGTRIQIPPEVEPGSDPPYRVVSITGPGDAPERVSDC